MRRTLLTLSAVFALVALAAPADAQFKFGAQGAVITSVDDLGAFVSGAAKLSGTFGLGARTAFQPPPCPSVWSPKASTTSPTLPTTTT